MKHLATKGTRIHSRAARRRPESASPPGWTDISVTISSGMVHWPGNPPVQIERVRAIEHGDDYNASRLSMSAHTGTHMDAPLHFLRSGRGLDQMPLDATVGPARVIQIQDPQQITVAELRPCRIQRGDRILFKTRNSSRCWKQKSFVKKFVHLSNEAANFLAEKGVRAVGVDYLSVGPYGSNDSKTVHQALLGAEVWIIEGLNLSRVRPGRYELVCLPLKIRQSDGAPARAILRPRRSV